MKYRLALPVAAAALSLLASSCTPWVEPGDQPPPMPPNGDAAARRNAPGNLDETERPAPRRRKADIPPDETDSTGGSHTAAPSETQSKGDEQGSGGDSTPQPPKKKERLPTGIKTPKPNIVLSPYTNKRVDVSGIPSGKTAEDPTSGGKHFIVP